MKKLAGRLGILTVVSFFVMGVGLLVFLLTPVLYGFWEIDSDLPGAFIFVIGVILFIIGFIRRPRSRKP